MLTVESRSEPLTVQCLICRCCSLTHQLSFLWTRGVPFLAIQGISDQANAQVGELESADLAMDVWHATIVAVGALTWSGGSAST
jgi:hypothetical protein